MPAITDKPLSLSTIETLMSPCDDWCISMYLPTHRAGKEIREDPIRLKNRIQEAEQQLEEAGMGTGDVHRMFESLRERCDLDTEANREFWRHQGDGLAVLMRGGEDRIYKLQVPVDELTLVAHRLHVKPLLQSVQRDREYCLLAVSANDVRFLEGSRGGLSERSVDDLPDSLQAVVRGDHQKGFNLHSFQLNRPGGENAVPHGHVESNQEHELRRYFRTIAEALGDEMHANDHRPLMFAGVGELFPYFQDCCEYRHLIEQPVEGNPDDMSEDQLHEKAWPSVEATFRRREEEAIQRWEAAAHTDLGEQELGAVLNAAHDGRIDTLLVRPGVQQWGRYDAESRSAAEEDESTAKNYDLLDLAVVKTLQADGRVVFIEEADWDSDLSVAAICRYPLA